MDLLGIVQSKLILTTNQSNQTCYAEARMPLPTLRKRTSLQSQTIEINHETNFKMLKLVNYKRFIIRSPQGGTITISQQEMFCLVYFILGHSLVEIAEKVAVAPQTVSCYLERVKRKFDCYSKAELLFMAYQSRLLQLAFEITA